MSALLGRWGIEADDSAGRPLSQLAPGTLLLAIASAAADDLAPVPLLALLKHPLVGGEGDERLSWLDDVRSLDLALRGPGPRAGSPASTPGSTTRAATSHGAGFARAWQRPPRAFAQERPLAGFAAALGDAATQLAGDRAWAGQAGRACAELLAELQALDPGLVVGAEDGPAILRQLLDGFRIRPPYGGHPRVAIWGLLEARLQQADLMVLGGLNEGVWPALPAPDPWLAPKIRSNLGLPGLEFRVGLSAQDFASALGAPQVLITRALAATAARPRSPRACGFGSRR